MLSGGWPHTVVEGLQGDLLVRLIERVHDNLNKELVDLIEKVLDGILTATLMQ